VCFAPNHPQKAEWGQREVPFSRELWVERDDFMVTPEKGFFRLTPGGRVRLRYAYVIECTGFEQDEEGKVSLIRARYFPDSRSGTPGADTYKVKGNIHWLSISASASVEIRLFDRLFTDSNPGAAEDFRPLLNVHSRTVIEARVEEALSAATPGSHWQFERKGYFTADLKDSQPGHPVFNMAVSLKDTWQK
jgi:glutaminyl-tRNA synthetase